MADDDDSSSRADGVLRRRAMDDQVPQLRAEIAQMRDHFDRRFDHVDKGFAEHERRITIVENVQAVRLPQLEAVVSQAREFGNALRATDQRMAAIENALSTNTEITNSIKADTEFIVRTARGAGYFARAVGWCASRLRDGVRWIGPFLLAIGGLAAAIELYRRWQGGGL